MISLEQTIEFLVWASLISGFFEAYLLVNKLWTRKHIPDVAASISITATVMNVVATSPFFLKYALDADFSSILNTGTWMAVAVFRLLVGAGFWVMTSDNASFRDKLVRMLRLERREALNLAAYFRHHHSAGEALETLVAVAALDGEVLEQELDLVRELGESWGVEHGEVEAMLAADHSTDPRVVHERVLRFADALVPVAGKEAGELKVLADMIDRVVSADENVSEDERAMQEEIHALLSRRESVLEESHSLYEVLLVPQSDEQTRTLRERFGREMARRLGGLALVEGTYHAASFADHLCEVYRDDGFLAVVAQVQSEPATA